MYNIKDGGEFHMQYFPHWLRNIGIYSFSETDRALLGSTLDKCKCYWQYTADLFTHVEVVENIILCAKLF